MSDVAVDAGTVGGDVESFANQGRIAAGIAVRILNGESPENIPIVRDTGIYEFDWRALKRWGLKETDLPSGSLVIDHQLSVWQAYWRYILAGILLLLAQVLIILALLWQRAKKRKISSELALSNHRLSLAMASGKSVGWESDLATGCDYLFGDLRAVFGIPSDTHRAPVGDFYRYIHPEDLQRVSEAMNDAKKNRTPYFQEFRLLSPDGATRWVASRGTFEYAPNGKPVRMTGLVFDITERKEIEEALKNSEEKFSKAFRESPLVLTLTSTKDHRYIDVNDTFEKITGWKREEAIGRTPLDLGLWVDSAQRLKFNKRLLAEGSVRNHESDFRMKDGQIRIGLGATELIDIHGEPCALSVIADITEAKLAEQERQVSERRFSQFFETLPEYSYLISLDGNILDANSAACKALGYSKKELIGKNISDVYAPESNSRMIDLLKKWRETGRLYNEEMVVLTKQGKRRIVLLNAGSVTDAYGNLQYFTSVQVDVTDRKEMELLLQENQGRLAAIVGSAMDAIIAIDQFQRIIVFNVAAEKMFGCSARDAIGTPIQRFIPQRFHGRDGEHIRNFGKTGATGKASGGLGTLWALRANGEEFPIEVSTAQFEVSGKEIFTIIIRDITERRQAEEALSNMSRKLIEAQEEERTRLARELHDDINQRIALLSVMLKHAIQELPAEAVEARQRMEDLCDRALSISTGIQALSHRLHSSKLDYLGLKTAAAGFCREFSDQHGVAIDFRSDEIPKTLPKEVSLCLFRVLQEALQNSAKHSGSSHVRVTMENTQKELRLTVEDSGKGFDPEMAMKGTGVGLTNMKERMKLVRGELSIESQPGKGTVIRATAPLDRAAKSAQVAT
jgi:PAS domain S-box-containing protein